MAAKKRGKLRLWLRRKKRARAKAKAARKPRHIGTMDIILIIVGVALVAFTIEMIRIFRETGMVPDTLITCVFAALGGECGVMGWIKTTKERNKERKWEQEDRAHQEQRESTTMNEQEAQNGTQRND